MKKIFLVTLFLANILFAFSNEVYEKAVVDERMELMSVVFRLAEAEEYLANAFPLYVDEIDKHFAKYKEHSLIEFTKVLRKKHWMSFDAIADMAISLKIKNGKIEFNKDIKIETLDDRWPQDSIPKYIKLLNDFYKKTKFHDFFIKNENLLKAAEENFAKNVTDKIDFEWFKSFFRVLPDKKFKIIIYFTGMNNFGPKIVYKDGTEEYYAIISSYSNRRNKENIPTYEDKYGGYKNILIHEICHSFVDSPINEYLEKLLPQATVFYQLYQKELYEYALCGAPEYFLGETFVRACMSIYDNEQYGEYDEYMLREEVRIGFLWLPQLIKAFEKYKNDTTYKTFRDFMPEIVILQNSLNPQQLYDEVATITGTNITNNSDSVDYNLDHIKVYLNKPMLTKRTYTTSIYAQPKLEFTEEAKWNAEATEWTFYIKLEPNTQYEIWFPYAIFSDAKNQYYTRNTYILNFKTRPKQ